MLASFWRRLVAQLACIGDSYYLMKQGLRGLSCGHRGCEPVLSLCEVRAACCSVEGSDLGSVLFYVSASRDRKIGIADDQSVKERAAHAARLGYLRPKYEHRQCR